MVLDQKPKRMISHDEINNWNSYCDGLSSLNHIKKYLETVLKKWIDEIDNPLIIPWIRQLYNHELGFFDNALESLENQIGENNLEFILSELSTHGSQPIDLIKKVKSLQSEVFVYSHLSNIGHKNIKKITEIGDYESDSAIISVKSILDLDINYQIIENVIWSLLFIQENDVLWEYAYIQLMKGDGIDDRFLKNIISFIEKSLITLLEYINSEQDTGMRIKIEKFVPLFDGTGQNKGNTRFSVCNYYQDNEINLLIDIIEKRKFESKNNDHKLQIKITKRKENEHHHFHVAFDTEAYVVGTPLDLSILKNRVERNLEKFDKIINQKSFIKDFIGWIDISISPMHTNFVKNKIDLIKEELMPIKSNRQYTIYVSLTPQFPSDLKAPIYFEL